MGSMGEWWIEIVTLGTGWRIKFDGNNSGWSGRIVAWGRGGIEKPQWEIHGGSKQANHSFDGVGGLKATGWEVWIERKLATIGMEKVQTLGEKFMMGWLCGGSKDALLVSNGGGSELLALSSTWGGEVCCYGVWVGCGGSTHRGARFMELELEQHIGPDEHLEGVSTSIA
ncbi:hypothetical protein BU16DRAFT_584717 [Lophium mytilinum]|uniref:Uncharacterized protein n=1 Tax=Lophium mytilinum TaxID=390894 RepID=A0A6A6QGX7_9PEZI|nr:hypothetical protein BU16DRAFT_584717 [Lophium mytilinum]